MFVNILQQGQVILYTSSIYIHSNIINCLCIYINMYIRCISISKGYGIDLCYRVGNSFDPILVRLCYGVSMSLYAASVRFYSRVQPLVIIISVFHLVRSGYYSIIMIMVIVTTIDIYFYYCLLIWKLVLLSVCRKSSQIFNYFQNFLLNTFYSDLIGL